MSEVRPVSWSAHSAATRDASSIVMAVVVPPIRYKKGESQVCGEKASASVMAMGMIKSASANSVVLIWPLRSRQASIPLKNTQALPS